MEAHEIKKILKESLNTKKIYISFNNSHLQVITVSNIFTGMNKLDRHKKIYIQLNKYILEKKIHSISIKAYTPKEWEEFCKLSNED